MRDAVLVLQNQPSNYYEVHRLVNELMLKQGAKPERRTFIYSGMDRHVVIRAEKFPDSIPSMQIHIPTKGAVMNFRLLAAPERKVGDQRYPFQAGDLEGRIAWLRKEASKYGFEIISFESLHSEINRINKPEHPFLVDHFRVSGRLRVLDRDAFEYGLRRGIGRVRGLGFGLLIISKEGVH